MKPYYQDDYCTIYHGDCRDILPGLDKVDLVLTDPPYGLGDKWKGGTWGSKKMYKDAKRWDHKISQGVLMDCIDAGHNAIIWGGNYYFLPPCRGFLAWIKTPQIPTMADLEIAWTTFDYPAKAKTECRNPRGNGRREHATQKPLSIMAWCIQQADKHAENNSILDPFMGSGTTLRSAKDLSRKAIGIEVEEKYCEIAVNRLKQEVFSL